jgi:hypothetical protein
MSGGAIFGMGYLIPQSFATGGNLAVSKFFVVITSDPWYPRYKTLTGSLMENPAPIE